MDLILSNLAPNRTATIQLYERDTNTAAGSPIGFSGESDYTYTFPIAVVGDFDYELIGFTDQPGSRRALRVTATDIFEAADWWIIELMSMVAPGGGGSPSTGLVPNLLSADYEDDWAYLDGIEDCGYVFSAQRVTVLTPPSSGVKVKRAAPSHKEIAGAMAAIGYESTDVTMVIFAQTLRSGASIIEPIDGDIITAFDARWIIKSYSRTVDLSQWRCYCRRSTLTTY